MKKEFTLVELMVVIGIIAILAGILLPVLNKSRDKAIQTECAGNLGQLTKAEFAYSADNEQKFLGGVPERVSGNWNKSWVAMLYDYVKETKTFECGADENDDTKDDTKDDFGSANGGEYVVSYLNNAGLWASQKRYLCERPTIVMLYGPREHDGAGKPLGAYYRYPTASPSNDDFYYYDRFDFTDTKMRHNQVSNFAFVDGHTEAMNTESFMTKNNKSLDREKRCWWGFGEPPKPW